MPQLLDVTALEAVFAPYRLQLGNYNRWLNPASDLEQAAAEGEVIPAGWLLDADFLRTTLTRWGATLGANNLKVEASLWAKYYCASLYALVLGAMSLGGLGLDASLANTRLVLSRTAGSRQWEGVGYPSRVILVDSSNSVVYPPRCKVPGLAAKTGLTVGSAAQLQQIVFKRLFESHLLPLFDRFHAVTGVSQKVLWGNLGAGIYAFYHLLASLPGCQAVKNEDAPALLDTPRNDWIAPGKNPLYRPVLLRPFNEAGLTEPALVRASCCLWYKVPQAQKCATCPLIKPAEKVERSKALAAH